jgi:long-chain acyl-CoA synthetase
VAAIVADSGARLCFADGSTAITVREALRLTDGSRSVEGPQPVAARGHCVVVAEVRPEAGEVAYGDLIEPGRVVTPRDPESLAVLLYTSGTSATPRGAMLTHRALLANIDQTAATSPPPVGPDDVVLGVLPLFHVYGLNAVLGQVLRHGATLAIGKRLGPDETLGLVETAAVTCVPVAPAVVAAWASRDDVGHRLSSVTTVLSGAAPLAEDVVARFESRTGLRVEQGYGLTEAAPVVTSTLGTGIRKPGSSGRPVPGVEVRVSDADGNDVHIDDPGEIWVRGKNLFSGYWPDGERAPVDGWLRTGDVGFLDSDGDLFIVDRLDELVSVSGFNVYPAEIENIVLGLDEVAECAVIGVRDLPADQSVVAYVVPTPGTDSTGLEETVIAHCRERLARFKVPTAVRVVARLPHSATGKVAKGRLRLAADRAAFDVPGPLLP